MNITSIIRNLLTLIGSFLIGRHIFNQTIDAPMWDVITGSVMALTGVIMSIADKTVTIEKVQGVIRHVVLSIGGIMIAGGIVKPEQIELWLGAITALTPIIYGWLSKKKTQQVASGEVTINQLKQ